MSGVPAHDKPVALERPRSRGARLFTVLVVAAVVVLAVVVPGLAFVTGFTKADGGHVIVIRNGGPFDDNSIRQVIQPNSGLTPTGDGDEGWSAFLVHPRFVLSKVDLPGNVQEAINQAQAAFPGVTESQAALQRAQIDAQANAARQAGYDACPTCAQIDIMKALPSGLTTYAPGAGVAVAPR